ncbi:MAG TPA: hypothetical protein VFB21_24520, partial [Chthonomonadaceae bacterium]|nr:hypothetical protein [Chthonomonadaceae bacterium]
AHLHPDYHLYAALKIEYLTRLPNRAYPHDYSYMAMYAGAVRALEPINIDPAGIITGRSLFTRSECEKHLLAHDQILLQEAIAALAGKSRRLVMSLGAFLQQEARTGLKL